MSKACPETPQKRDKRCKMINDIAELTRQGPCQPHDLVLDINAYHFSRDDSRKATIVKAPRNYTLKICGGYCAPSLSLMANGTVMESSFRHKFGIKKCMATEFTPREVKITYASTHNKANSVIGTWYFYDATKCSCNGSRFVPWRATSTPSSL